MNNRPIILLFAISILVLVQSGCDEPPNLVTAEIGSAYGYVILHDAAGNPVNSSGVTVTLAGTTDSTVTDSLGMWVFTQVSVGYAEVICSKPGYFSVATFWYENIADNAVHPIYMGLIPTFTVDSLEATTTTDAHTVTFTGTVALDDSIDHYIALFFTPNVIDTSVGVNWFSDEVTVRIPKNSTHFTYTMLVDLRFYAQNYITSGATLYAVAYPLPVGAPFPDIAPDGSAFAWRNHNVPGSNTVTVTVP